MTALVESRPEIAARRHRIDYLTSIPFFFVHAAALGVFFLPFGGIEVGLCVGLYLIRMFAITAGYHRYFSHRTFRTGRVFQFVLALLGTLSVQKGVLWWAAHHRTHHARSDREGDIHSPERDGFVHSHLGWILTHENDETDLDKIPDFARYPELRWLNQHFLAPFVALCVGLFLAGGWSWLVWGGFLSTVFLWHVTFCINSVAHLFGRRRFPTTDGSRNSLILALLTGGEGWHNNHHHYPNSVNQGFYWWEIDWTYGVLRVLALFGIVRDLRRPPERILRQGRS